MSIKIFDDLIFKRNEKIFNDYGIDNERIKMIKFMIEQEGFDNFKACLASIVAMLLINALMFYRKKIKTYINMRYISYV